MRNHNSLFCLIRHGRRDLRAGENGRRCSLVGLGPIQPSACGAKFGDVSRSTPRLCEWIDSANEGSRIDRRGGVAAFKREEGHGVWREDRLRNAKCAVRGWVACRASGPGEGRRGAVQSSGVLGKTVVRGRGRAIGIKIWWTGWIESQCREGKPSGNRVMATSFFVYELS